MNRTEIYLLSILLVVTLFLRFPDLGYSDYIGDEHKAFFQLEKNESTWDFFTNQRKGPMQFAVSYMPYLFTHDFRNELAERLPFTIFNTASVFVFYAFVRRLTKDKWSAFLAAFLFSVNGFVVGFSRIAQYQNLNLFFSSLALYLYHDFREPTKNILRNTLLGTVAFSLSLLSNWDDKFVIPIIW
jgi:4-amino-4-deoxy-L-arabinose transferase-like glycosyltransferase